MNQQIQILVEVPIASFRQSRAREYAETCPVPPPSTVYGMLLSMVGEIDRFGGLSLGESRDLVNSVQILHKADQKRKLSWLVQSEDGLLTLPYWVDHVGSKGTRWLRYIQEDFTQNWQVPDRAWTVIQPN